MTAKSYQLRLDGCNDYVLSAADDGRDFICGRYADELFDLDVKDNENLFMVLSDKPPRHRQYHQAVVNIDFDGILSVDLADTRVFSDRHDVHMYAALDEAVMELCGNGDTIYFWFEMVEK